MQDPERILQDCQRYEKELGKDYRRLYQMKDDGADEQAIKEQKARIKADKSRLKHLLKRGNSG